MNRNGWQLMNVVQVIEIPQRQKRFSIWCAWCNDWYAHKISTLYDANDIKISHENDHGIYLDPETGEMYHDPEDSYI